MERKIAIIGIPMDLGQSRRGVDMGPSAIRYAGLHHCLKQLDYTVEDLGNIYIEQSNEEKQLIKSESSQNLRNLNQVVRASETLAYLVDQVMKQDKLPLILGGDHSISIGSIAGISNHYDQLGVIWFDAHGDMNREDTSPSGNIHGMPLAVNLGYGHHRLINVFKNNRKVLPGNVVVIGVRALDEGEKQFIKEHDIKMYTMHEIDRLGMTQVITETVDYLKAKTDGVHVSFDLDCIDPQEAPGVGTPVTGGLTYRESHLAMEMLAEANIVTSAEFVEVNPMLDERGKTAHVTVGLIESLFGKKLY